MEGYPLVDFVMLMRWKAAVVVGVVPFSTAGTTGSGAAQGAVESPAFPQVYVPSQPHPQQRATHRTARGGS
jgi:hypothetical protein